MTFDLGPHRTPLAACPPAPNYGDAAGPIRLVIDPLGNRVDLNPPTPPAEPEADEPLVITRSE